MTVPLNTDAIEALVRLRKRAAVGASIEADHSVFPACEHGMIDLSQHQKSWKTAWRNLTKAAGLAGFRFHDPRHGAITEMAEAGIIDATLEALRPAI